MMLLTHALSFTVHHPERVIGALIIIYAVLATLIVVGKGELD